MPRQQRRQSNKNDVQSLMHAIFSFLFFFLMMWFFMHIFFWYKNSTTTFHFHSVRKEFCYNKYEEKRFFMFYIFFFVVVVNFTQMYILAKVFAKTRSFIASVAAATFLNKLSRPWIEVRLLIYLLKEKFIRASSNYFGWSLVVSGNWPLSCAMYLDNLASRNF